MAYITNVRIKNKVAKVFDLSPEQVVSECRIPIIVQAKYAYVLAVHLLGNDAYSAKNEISENTRLSYFINRGIEYFKTLPKYRELIEEIVGCYDYDVFKKFSEMHPLGIEDEIEDQEESVIDEGGKLFYFTQDENKMIAKAIMEAEKYMETYGKGLKQMPIVDRKKYY